MKSILRKSKTATFPHCPLRFTRTNCTFQGPKVRRSLIRRSPHRPPNRRTFSHALRDDGNRSQTPDQEFEHGRRPFPSLDTIYALSTAPGPAAIAVIRVSGSACVSIYQGLCPGRHLPAARIASIRKLYGLTSAASAPQLLDSATLVLYFPAPNTVTGEDVLELHTHGGPAIVRAVLSAISNSPAAGDKTSKTHTIRYAEPGEFTKRAFYNNRLDLTQIECLGDSLTAETEQQRRLAVSGTDDNLGKRYERWRDLLLNARGELEALIDFAEDQHLDESPSNLVASVSEQVRALMLEVTLHVSNASKGDLLRRGISIALLGRPNAGKSSLLNRIVGREAAIVSAEEGTTRDIVDVSVDIGGWLCRLGDMAGLRSSSPTAGPFASFSPISAIEKEGMRRARSRALASDLVVIILSMENSLDGSADALNVDEELIAAAKECHSLGKAMAVVINKIDKLPGILTHQRIGELYDLVKGPFPFISEEDVFAISCLEASNPSVVQDDPGRIQNLLHGLQQVFAKMIIPCGIPGCAPDQSYWEKSLSVSHRQSEYLQHCLLHLTDFLTHDVSQSQHSDHNDLVAEVDVVAAAEHLRSAADCLARITGKGGAGDVEEVLGVVFEKFCVGK